MTHASLKLQARQTQALTPRLQYAVKLLQMSSIDYEQELREVTGKNPFLESEEREPPLAQAAVPWAADQPSAEPAEPTGAEPSAVPGGEAEPDPFGLGRDSWLSAPGANREPARDPHGSAMEMVALDAGLRAHLRSQANVLPLSARDHALVCAIVESLDDDGYLRCELDEIAAASALEPEPDACEMSTALKLVQSFDPAGVGARGVGECLLLQLEMLAPAQRELAAAILSGHLAQLAERDVSGMARALGRSADEVDRVCTAIRRLDPRPGWRFGRSDAQYIVPDVVVRKSRDRWIVELNPVIVPRLRLNQPYAELFQRHRLPSHGELAGHLLEARWALRNIEQRFSTILQVAQSILKRQYGFFEYGPLAMKPLALRDVAQEIGVHESTVCRVTNNKYMTTPTGIMEMKQFFSRPMPMASGKSCSATAIRGVINEMIADEDATRPLSDVDITQQLARQGLVVARRTVTKYRQLLRVPAVERRRKHVASASA